MSTKYISFKRKRSNFTEMVMFPETLTHEDMKRHLGDVEVVGAGFIRFSVVKDESQINVVQLSCYGRSESLEVGVHKDDTDIAHVLFTLND